MPGLGRVRHPRRQDGERLRQQGVAGQDGHGLAERPVARGLPVTQVIVVHRRQVVVDERIRVDHLDGAGRRHGLLDRPAAGFGRQEDQHGPQFLSAPQDHVPHGLVKPLAVLARSVRTRIGRGQGPVEGLADHLAALAEDVAKRSLLRHLSHKGRSTLTCLPAGRYILPGLANLRRTQT